MTEPKTYFAAMVSSTFNDLKDHRGEVIDALHHNDLLPKVMEYDTARADADVIDSSLQFVRESHAYICVIGPRYGQTPHDEARNPDRLSITELEFDEAQRLGRPILLFIASENHKWTRADFEFDDEKQEKLEAFCARAKLMKTDGEVHRVYAEFRSSEELGRQAEQAIANLAAQLDANPAPDAPAQTTEAEIVEDVLGLKPPLLRALPSYAASHSFIGRKAELKALDEWAHPDGKDPVLLFEAMGGSGKSMLTWEWATEHATKAHPGLKGRFWYSFYEDGATMVEFSRQALAYITGAPMKEIRKLNWKEASDQLMAALQSDPWLLVLDGLERVLVAYHRPEAAAMNDAAADDAGDELASRDPRAAIRPEDDDLLRLLTKAGPSRILISSRLTPRILVNKADKYIPGVSWIGLGGLTPEDAAAMLIADSIETRDRPAMQQWLQDTCGGHPLTVGALAGVVADHPPAPGDFDEWVKDPKGGAAVDFASLDLVQRRSHIVSAALERLDEPASALLRTLSLLQGGADYALLEAVNPHLPEKPKEIDEPEDPEKDFMWSIYSEERKSEAKEKYAKDKERYPDYLSEIEAWRTNDDVSKAPGRLRDTMRDLKRRGLLLRDESRRRYDLHPVVRGTVRDQMNPSQRDADGGRLVDHFNAQPVRPYEDAEELEDLSVGLDLVRTLTQVGRFEEALNTLNGTLGTALYYLLNRLDVNQELIKPFFPDGFEEEPVKLSGANTRVALTEASNCISKIDPDLSLCLRKRCIVINLERQDEDYLAVDLRNLVFDAGIANFGARAERWSRLAVAFADERDSEHDTFMATLRLFEHQLNMCVDGACATTRQNLLNAKPTGQWSSHWICVREIALVKDDLVRGFLTGSRLAAAESLINQQSKTSSYAQEFSYLRGIHHLDCGETDQAEPAFACALSLVRASGAPSHNEEAWHGLTRLRLGHRDEAQEVANGLDARASGDTMYLPLAELWAELGDHKRAIEIALRAHDHFVGQGEPYVNRWWLNRTRNLLESLGEPLPEIRQYDPASDPPEPWEAEVREFIKKKKKERLEREAKKKAKAKGKKS